jgi:hypothetical protein
VNHKQLVAGIVSKAKKYRTLGRMVGDQETAHRIWELTEELKQQATAVASPNKERIRKRAQEIWEENGGPSGRDQEFWLQAEREFREAEELAKECDEL